MTVAERLGEIYLETSCSSDHPLGWPRLRAERLIALIEDLRATGDPANADIVLRHVLCELGATPDDLVARLQQLSRSIL